MRRPSADILCDRRIQLRSFNLTLTVVILNGKLHIDRLGLLSRMLIRLTPSVVFGCILVFELRTCTERTDEEN